MTSNNGFAKTMLHFFSETTISSFSGSAPSVLAMAFRLSRRVFRTVTVRNETRSSSNEPKSRCNGNRRCCLSFEWCGEVELRTPKYENPKSCFFLCLEFRLSEQNGEIQQKKVTRKIAGKKVCIIIYFLAERGGFEPPVGVLAPTTV